MKQKYHCRFKMLSTTKRPAVESLHKQRRDKIWLSQRHPPRKSCTAAKGLPEASKPHAQRESE